MVLLAIEYYSYQGLKVAVGSTSDAFQRVSKFLFFALSTITFTGFILFEPLSKNAATRSFLTFFMTIGIANILGKILFAIWLLIDDLIRLARLIWAKLNPQVEVVQKDGISRIEFLTQAGAVSAALPLLGMGWGVVSGAHDYRVLKRTIELSNLPEAFDGLTITQISDIHSGSFWNRNAVERGIALVNEQKSDLIFFTGDLVNNVTSELDGWTDLFGSLRADLGVYSVLGNHDYGDYVQWESDSAKRKNLTDLIETQKRMGWDLLMDENRTISKGDDQISIVGMQNWGAKGRFPKYGDLEKAMKGTAKSSIKLLLSHDPSHWKEQVLPEFKDVDIMFSGHTHGFQFGIEVGQLKWSPVKYFYPEWADLYTKGAQHLYVNRGFGYLGYPGRLGILPEITVITLRRSEG